MPPGPVIQPTPGLEGVAVAEPAISSPPPPQAHSRPPIAPPKGLAGLFDGYAPGQIPGEILDVSRFPAGMVYCNVYDLGDNETFRKINQVTTGGNNVLVAGLFHAGIEVFGGEWCYGYTVEDRSGVSCIPPRSHPQHTYRTTIPLGVTRFSYNQVAELTRRLAQEWRGNEYHLIHKNCQNFANALCAELGVNRMPGWVDRAARAASAIDTTSKQLGEQVTQTRDLVRGMSLQVEETVRGLLPQDEADVERIANETADQIRRGSAQALELAEQRAKEIADAAYAGVEVVQQQAGEIGTVVQRNVTTLFSDEFVEETQENFRAFGRGLTQTFADLGLWGATEQRRRSPSAVVEDIRCPGGHGLCFVKARRGSCDGCGQRVQDGDRVLECRPCNFYLCRKCTREAAMIPKDYSNRGDAAPTGTGAAAGAAGAADAAGAVAGSISPAASSSGVPDPGPGPVDLLGDDRPASHSSSAAAAVDLLSSEEPRPAPDGSAGAGPALTGGCVDLLGDLEALPAKASIPPMAASICTPPAASAMVSTCTAATTTPPHPVLDLMTADDDME
eukprot:CAMPEP_0206471634 /NCGR_PEP_ID=MMETSP0324_2-20121206/31689_1 /ASSEMBLY_ACC=CAM_ASM_000836 /TAXON_ID=2866 /ORGANISM="Crypthecodinium cohnii, Strain Seligo" /LENGTH=559 /DNA_ID=CAMNT_0053946015 /DNA_START=66 /DNA_END=1745 /DNA_ORIENTATION=+